MKKGGFPLSGVFDCQRIHMRLSKASGLPPHGGGSQPKNIWDIWVSSFFFLATKKMMLSKGGTLKKACHSDI
jgi:hypothetical protein